MSLYEASVAGRFSASHAVRMPDGTMEPAHAHDWRVTAVFRAERLNDDGFVVDFLAVNEALGAVTDELADADLNAMLGRSEGASAERVAEHLAGRLAERLGRAPHCVRVTEAPGCEAAYYPHLTGLSGEA